MAEKSLFLRFFGASPNFCMIDFLLEHRLEDFTKTDIAKGAGISWASLFNHWEALEEHGIVKPTRTIGRATLYQLDEAAPIVKRLKSIEMALMEEAGGARKEKMLARAGANKTARR